MRATLRDERGLVGRAAVVLLVLVVLGGIAAIDAVSIVFTKFSTQNAADAAAVTGAATYKRTKQVSTAVEDALKEVRSDFPEAVLCAGKRFKGCDTRIEVDRRTGDVAVTLRRAAATLVVQRVSFLEDLGVVRESATGEPPL